MARINILNLAVAMLLLSDLPGLLLAAEPLEAQAKAAMENFKKADSTIHRFFDTAAGHVIFPKVSKGGLILGGAHGRGLVYEKGKLIGSASLTQGTIGAQIGGQVFSEVIFFETQEALNTFKQSRLEMSAQLSAVAAAEGVAKNAKYQQGVAIFTLPKAGLMAEASVGGQKFTFHPIVAEEKK